MSDLFEIDKIVSREHFPGGPNENPGIRLSEGYLPGWTFAGRFKYAHVADVTRNGEVLASPVDAVAEETGRVLLPGKVVVVNIAVEPPEVVKYVGEYVYNNNVLNFQPVSL